MAGLNCKIGWKTRLCQVGDELGQFHIWEQWSNVVDASPLRGGHPGGQIGQVYGIVEFKDGVRRIDPAPYIRILDGLMGLNGEAGEAIDILKKVLFQGHEFDREHMAKELGDIAWYLAVSADAIGYDLETIFQMNIDKLKSRYPDGFDTEQSQNRAVNDI